MKCPMSARTMYAQGPDQVLFAGECIKEECAWWNDFHPGCAISSIATSLILLQGIIDSIKNKIPPVEQFGK